MALAFGWGIEHNATDMKNDYPRLRAFLRAMPTQADQERFAAKCGTTLNYIRKAMSKGSKMDVSLVERIVAESGFCVPPDELRPDVKWETFADASVIDVMGNPKKAARAARRAEVAVPA